MAKTPKPILTREMVSQRYSGQILFYIGRNDRSFNIIEFAADAMFGVIGWTQLKIGKVIQIRMLHKNVEYAYSLKEYNEPAT
jgi:hypothetical protein